MEKQILAPAAVLVLWTLFMLVWMGVTRGPAMAKSGIDIKNAPPGGRGQDLDGVIAASAQWKAHNYNHLLEQPTIFYATVVILAVAGAGTTLNIALAYAYVGIRIVHSIWQATVNKVMPVRASLFMLSSLCLLVLAINALRATLGE